MLRALCCKLCTVYCILFAVHSIIYTASCILYHIRCTEHHMIYAIHYISYTIYYMLCAVCCAKFFVEDYLLPKFTPPDGQYRPKRAHKSKFDKVQSNTPTNVTLDAWTAAANEKHVEWQTAKHGDTPQRRDHHGVKGELRAKQEMDVMHQGPATLTWSHVGAQKLAMVTC